MSRPVAFLLSVCLLLASAAWFFFRQAPLAPIRIGVLHSLTGTMAVSEQPLVDAVRLATEQLNERGGVLGRSLELVVADGKSDWAVFAREAERLISDEKVDVLFACWTSACRQAVRPVVERHNHLMFYPIQYEGLEQSPNILYTGSAPNQQIVPGTRWAMNKFGQRIYLLGSDYVFPRTANRIIRDLVNASNGTVLAERYLTLGSRDVAAAVEDIRRQRPDVVLNTINGDSNAAFFDALVKSGMSDLPVVSFSVAEPEMVAWQGSRLQQHYGVWSYFQSVENDENRRFVAAWHARFGADRVTSDPVEAAYVGVRLWAQAVEDAGSSQPERANATLLRQSMVGPSGVVAVDARSRHLWKMVRMGKVLPNGQFEQIFASRHALHPEPWPFYRSRHEWLRTMEPQP